MMKYNKIRTYFYLYKKSFILATITGVTCNALMALVPIFQGKLLDLYLENKDVKYILLMALSFLLFVIFIQVNRYFKRYYVRDFSNRMTLKLRTISYHNLITSDIKDFSDQTKGDIMNKNLADIKDASEGVRKVLTEIYDTVILLIGYFISMFILDYKITLMVTPFIILSILSANLLKNKIYKSTSTYKKEFSKMKDITLSNIDNELYYRGFGVSKTYYNDYKEELNVVEKKGVKSKIYKSSFEPLYQLIALIGLIFVIYFGGKNYIDGIWLIGSFTAYLSTFVLVASKASRVARTFNAVSSLRVSWIRCVIYLNDYKVQDVIELDNKNSLVVSNLSFGFDNTFSLKNISFELECGESLGIAGKIHTGKSTLLAALSGLYQYDGSIKLSDVELKDAVDKLSNSFISYQPSKPEIFNDTLKYNISFDKTYYNSSILYTKLDKEIDEMKEKENTILSHSNSNLSGGQQKRLMISRSLNQNPRLLLLDDPFNAIDLNMSLDIVDNILNNYKDTILIIANNQKEILSKLDKVLFLYNDKYIIDTYSNLLNNKEFRKLMGE